ncbi:MAG: protein kinase, partial [Deltaproteobacteria bacterium]|nr:protein kinase [Deltaproteobacteria bacterium]
MVSNGGNFHLIGTTPHRHEEEGLEMLRAAMPGYPPFASWSLFTFFTDHGHPYEVDALVLTPKCLFLVEMKAWKGKVDGGSANYLTTFSKARGRESQEHPFALADRKAKAFMSKARRVSRNFDKRVQEQIRNLRFEALIWLTHAEGIDLTSSSAARSHVVHREAGLNEALQGRFPGAFTGLQNNSYNKETLRALTKVIGHDDFGLESRDKAITVDGGRFTLGKIIEAGDGYQDRWTEETPKTPRRRVRTYIVNRSRERNDANIEKRAQKEAKLLRGLEHPDILGLDTFDPDGPIGPAFVFRAFEGKSLTAFMEESKLTDDDRLAILDRIASALEYCHRNEIVHGALSPDAVLVRRLDDRTRSRDGKTDIEVKLTRFALATTEDSESSLSTRLLTQLGGSTASVFEAPEVRMGAKPSMASDIFSLGAIAYFLFSGKYPASSSAELTRKLIDNDGPFLSEVASELAHNIPALELAILAATYREQLQRKGTVPTPLAFLRLIEDALTSGEKKVGPAEKKIDPLDARKETRLVDDNDAKKVLIVFEKVGSGSTADVFKVKKEGEEQYYALKVPSADEHNERLEAESKTLELLGNKPGMSGLVRLVDTRTIGGRHCLLLEFAGDTLRDELREQGVLSLDFGRRWGQDLIAALRTLEECGVQHRDIKPSNIGVTSGVQKQKKHLLLFDFSLSSSDATQLNIGTRPYNDPELANRKRWDDAADRWAASITLYEMFTGSRPKFIDSAKGDALACTVEAERIDADVRHGLVEFFERAFCFNAKKRFSTADGMLEAFNKALYKVPDLPADIAKKKRKKLAGLDGNSSVSELDLSVREANALDRMGIYTLDELASLRSNTLSVVRGVGRQTAANIVSFIEEVRKHLKTPDALPTDVFLPGWHGLNDAVYSSILSKALSKELGDLFIAAGLQSSLDVALAPRQQVKNLADKARRAGATEKLSDIEHWLEELARITASDTPSTLKTAVDVVIPPSTKGQKRGNKAKERMRQFFGIDDIKGFDRHGKASDLARVAGVTRAAISLELVSTRNAWTDNDDTSALVDIIGDRVMGFLQSNGGVARIELIANDLMEEFTPDASLSATEQNRYAEALVRVAVEAGGGSRA